MSRTRYPTELVTFGQLNVWLRAVWLLAVVNAVIFIELLLIIVIVIFPYGLDVSYVQLASMGVGMLAVGVASGSLIVSARNDVLAQLASTAVYGGLAYGLLKLMNVMQGYEVLCAAGVLALSLAVAYAVEYARWLWTVRGNYAAVR